MAQCFYGNYLLCVVGEKISGVFSRVSLSPDLLYDRLTYSVSLWSKAAGAYKTSKKLGDL